MVKELKSNQSGYLIIESLMALLLGATIAITFIFSSSSNLTKSTALRQELLIRSIAEERMNLLVENPPTYSERLTLTAEEETIEYKEDDGDPKYNKSYKLRTTYKRFELPGLDQIQGKEEGEDNQDQFSAKIMDNIQKNLKELIWQVQIEVWDPENPESKATLSTLLYNDKAEVKIEAL